MPKETDIHIQNQKLYKYYKDFIIASFQILKKHLEDGESIPERIKDNIFIGDDRSIGFYYRSEPMFYRFIVQHEKEIKKLPQYISLINWRLQEDPIAKKFQGKVTDSKGNLVEKPKKSAIQFFFETNAWIFLAKFVEQIKSFDFDNQIFGKFYKEYEDSLYDEKSKYKSFAHLKQFQCEANEIDLEENLKIKKYSKEEVEKLWGELRESNILFYFPIPNDEIRNLNYFIEMLYTIKKGEPISDQLPKETFNKVISALRLFKNGTVGFDVIYSTELMWSKTGIGASSGLYHKSFIGTQYKLMNSDLEEFKKFWDLFKKIDGIDDFLAIAIRRFNYAYEKERPDDKLIDYMIAFEALFSEGSGDLRYKIPIRVAKLLETDFNQRKMIRNTMKAGYDARSDIVHGNRVVKDVKVKFDKDNSKKIPLIEFVSIIEDFLRKSITDVIVKAGISNVDKNIKENLLDEIDFEK